MLKEFWVEAMTYVVYILNRCPRILCITDPQELWIGRKSSVSHFKVFGCIGYTYIPDQRKTKLEDKSSKLIFIGYDAKSKVYKLFNPNNSKVVIRRDVEFNEEGA